MIASSDPAADEDLANSMWIEEDMIIEHTGFKDNERRDDDTSAGDGSSDKKVREGTLTLKAQCLYACIYISIGPKAWGWSDPLGVSRCLELQARIARSPCRSVDPNLCTYAS